MTAGLLKPRAAAVRRGRARVLTPPASMRCACPNLAVRSHGSHIWYP